MMSSGQKGVNVPNIFKWRWRGDSSLTTGLLNDAPPEIELSGYHQLPSSGSESPSGLLNGESLKVEPIADLDLFFEKLYNYHCEKGLWCIIIKWIVELLSLGFAICFSGFILLFVDWHGLLNAKCGMDAVESGIKPCDLVKEALHRHPLVPFTFPKAIIVGYLGIFSIYWIFCFLRFFAQLKDTLEVRRFYYNSLNITDRDVQNTPWAEILEKVVHIQSSQQLCVVKDLSAHDMVMRIMRKENYLIGMLNKGVLALPIPQWLPGAGPVVNSRENGKKHRLYLTKTLEWTLNWCILQSMFDRNFCIRRDFISNPSSLKKRLMAVGIGMLLISPFLVIFMLVYLFLRHAEQFYKHPSIAWSRRWSNLSMWLFREFNEVDYLFRHRINSSIVHADDYLKQFRSPIVTLIAKFISFVSGGLAAVLLIIALLEESLLEGHVFGHSLFWYGAVFGGVTTISRAAVIDEIQVPDTEGAMSLVVQHTHYMPKRWRAKENNDMVRTEFETLFQYTGMMLLEEMASIFLTPYLLLFVVPKRVDDVLQFISDFTVYVEGVGNVCSLSVFDFESHGNSKYGSPYNAARNRRSSQGKMEKSFLSFQSSYLSWEPNAQGKQFLSTLWNFREQQMHFQESQQAYSPRPTWLPAPHRRAGGEIHGFTSRDALYNRVGNRTAHQLGSLWSIDADRRNPPYLLDWYYMTHQHHAADDSPPSEVDDQLTGDYRIQIDGSEMKPRFEENWGFQVEDRLRSHMEASTSNYIFRESVFQHHDLGNPEHPSESHWWARSGPKPSDPHSSFIEPPSFGHHDSSQPYENFSDRSVEEQEGGVDWRSRSMHAEDQEGGVDWRSCSMHAEEQEGGVDWRSRSMRTQQQEGGLDWRSRSLSRTMYTNDCENDGLFNLPFNDIYSVPPPKGLHIRTESASDNR